MRKVLVTVMSIAIALFTLTALTADTFKAAAITSVQSFCQRAAVELDNQHAREAAQFSEELVKALPKHTSAGTLYDFSGQASCVATYENWASQLTIKTTFDAVRMSDGRIIVQNERVECMPPIPATALAACTRAQYRL
jgi:hypothetical protein